MLPIITISACLLLQWVKRQRYQYKLFQQGRTSTLSEERQSILNQVGFVWNSHEAAWMERWQELADYTKQNGNANLPTKYPPNPPLGTWVKCQRRQYKLYLQSCKKGIIGPSDSKSNIANGNTISNRNNSPNNKSTMTTERIAKLESLGFVWNPRGLQDS